MTTGICYDERHRAHSHPTAPESAERLEALLGALQGEGELLACRPIQVEPIPWEWVQAAHIQSHVDAVRHLSQQGKKRISFDTYLTPAAAEAARLQGGSEAFWKMHDELFRNQGRTGPARVLAVCHRPLAPRHLRRL